MYSVNHGNFDIIFQKQDKGIKVRVGNGKDKRYFCLVSSSKKRNVYTFEKDWVLLDTSTLEHDLEGESLKNDISDLIAVLLLYPVNKEYLSLEYDQVLFLEELSTELYLGDGKVKSLPHSNEYTMKDGTVTFIKGGYEYIYTMPSANGLSKAEFIKQGNNYPIPLKEDTESEYETDEEKEKKVEKVEVDEEATITDPPTDQEDAPTDQEDAKTDEEATITDDEDAPTEE